MEVRERLQVLNSDIFEPLLADRAGVVDQGGDWEATGNLVRGLARREGVREIDLHLMQPRQRPFAAASRQRYNLVALLEQRFADRRADPRAAAGYQGKLFT